MNKILTQLVATSLLCTSLAHASEGRESYGSALLGYGIDTTKSSGSSSSTGKNYLTSSARIGTSLLSEPSGILSLGLFGGTASYSETVGTLKTKSSVVAFAAEVVARKAFGLGLYFGGRFGIGLNSLELTSTTTTATITSSATSLAVGPVAGYEFPVLPFMNLDLDVSWMSLGGTTFNIPTVGSIKTDPSTSFVFQGGTTFHW